MDYVVIDVDSMGLVCDKIHAFFDGASYKDLFWTHNFDCGMEFEPFAGKRKFTNDVCVGVYTGDMGEREIVIDWDHKRSKIVINPGDKIAFLPNAICIKQDWESYASPHKEIVWRIERNK